MEGRIIEVTDASIERILNEGLNTNNLDHLQKLTKIRHMAKEDESMNNYGNYSGRHAGYDTYGRDNYGNYGTRGYDMRYRGNEHIERMQNEYGRYMENRQRYGTNDSETDKSFHYMVKALEDFIKVLHEEADNPQQKQELMTALQNSMR